MGMFDEIIVKQHLSIPDEIKHLDIDWSNHKFQTKDLDNCLSEYVISEDGYLYEHIIEREYIPFTEAERKDKELVKPWDIWKDVIEKGSHNKKIEDFHGTIMFYAFEELDDQNDFWLDYKAYFVYGKLDKIELIEFKTQHSRKESLEEWKDKIAQEQKCPWFRFKKWASKFGWSWFWKRTLNWLTAASNVFQLAKNFIIRHMI